MIGRSADIVFVVDGPLLQVLDATDGEPLMDYRAPTDLATFRTAVAGDGIVIVSSEWRGGAGPTSPTPPDPPDCTGGSVILETDFDGGPMIVTESPDGEVFCVEIDGLETFGFVPTVPSADPRFDSTMMFESGAFYTVVLPSGFPPAIEVIDEHGDEMTVARGVLSDYLVVFQAHVGLREGMPASVERTIELVVPDGEVLAELTFTGFSTEDQEVGATFEEFVSCAREHGVPILDPPAGGGALAVAEPSSPEVLRDAWESCRDLMESYFRSQQQQGPEYLANRRAVDNCLADAGYYPSLAQPIADPAAYESAIAACEAFSPARLALVDCLREHGLEVVVDGVVTGGPHPQERTTVGWEACREVYVTWMVDGPIVDDRIARFDCAAALGWITAVLDFRERGGATVNAVLASCNASTG